MSSCLGRAAVPVKRVWRGLSARLGRRRPRRTTGKLSTTYVPVANPEQHDDDDDVGVGRLRKDVRTCEYRDVHVMWDMLSGSSSNGDGGGAGNGRGGSRDVAGAAVAGNGAPATRQSRRRGKPAAPWSQLVAYCSAF